MKRFVFCLFLVVILIALMVTACRSKPTNYPEEGVLTVGDHVDAVADSCSNQMGVSRITLMAIADTATVEVVHGYGNWRSSSPIILEPSVLTVVDAGPRCEKYGGSIIGYSECHYRRMELVYIPGEGVRWRLLSLNSPG